MTLADAGNAGAGAGDTITLVYNEALSAASIAAALVGANTNNALAAGSGNITGALADIIGELGSFATATTATATATTLTLSADGRTVTLTLGGTVTDGTFPSGVFTPAATYADAHGNTINTAVTQTAAGNWGVPLLITSLLTADTDADGSIDRLVLTFDRDVNPATIVAGRFSTDIGSIAGVTNDAPDNPATIWVDLVDGVLDTGRTPRLTVAPDAVRDTFGLGVGAIPPYLSTDNARPVILYTLAVVGEPRIALHLSEAVTHTLTTDFAYSGASGVLSVPTSATSSYLVVLAGPVLEGEVTNGVPATITVNGSVVDGVGLSVDVAGRSHRVSDLGLGIISPTWAISDANPGTMTIFDGSGGVSAGNITLQGRVATLTYAGVAVTTANPAVDLVYDAAVEAAYVSNSLWLPTAVPGLVPAANPATRVLSQEPSSVNALRDYVIPGSDPEVQTGAEIQFFFAVGSLVHARVGNPADPNSIAPWRLPLRTVIRQRGGVTIANNVLNPDSGETTRLTVELESHGSLSVTVFDLKGDIVQVLYRGSADAGERVLTWDGRNRSGRAVARGIYFIRVVGPDLDETRKVMIVR